MKLLLFIVAFMYSSGGLVKKCTARSTSSEVRNANGPAVRQCVLVHWCQDACRVHTGTRVRAGQRAVEQNLPEKDFTAKTG